MMTDLEIAQKAEILKVKEIAKKVNLSEDDIELYGNYKAKINPDLLKDKKEKAKLILVTAINPTPAGEGKSTVTIGLADALNKLNKIAGYYHLSNIKYQYPGQDVKDESSSMMERLLRTRKGI